MQTTPMFLAPDLSIGMEVDGIVSTVLLFCCSLSKCTTLTWNWRHSRQKKHAWKKSWGDLNGPHLVPMRISVSHTRSFLHNLAATLICLCVTLVADRSLLRRGFDRFFPLISSRHICRHIMEAGLTSDVFSSSGSRKRALESVDQCIDNLQNLVGGTVQYHPLYKENDLVARTRANAQRISFTTQNGKCDVVLEVDEKLFGKENGDRMTDPCGPFQVKEKISVSDVIFSLSCSPHRYFPTFIRSQLGSQ